MISIPQIRAARGLLGWSQTRLAEEAGLSLPTVKRYETASALRVSDNAIAAIRQALEAAGIEFTNVGQPGVRVKGAAVQPDVQLEVGDFVKYREDRCGGDLKNMGKIGRLIDPGHTRHFSTDVCVEFGGDGGTWVNKGMLILVGKGKPPA